MLWIRRKDRLPGFDLVFSAPQGRLAAHFWLQPPIGAAPWL